MRRFLTELALLTKTQSMFYITVTKNIFLFYGFHGWCEVFFFESNSGDCCLSAANTDLKTIINLTLTCAFRGRGLFFQPHYVLYKIVTVIPQLRIEELIKSQ
jgi:hypothetical protein